MPDELILVSRVPGQHRHEVRWRLYLTATIALVLGVLVHGWVAHAADRPFAVATAILLGGLLTSTLVHQTWVHPAGGRLLHRRVWVVSWEVPWTDARVVRLRHNFRGLVVLQVRGRGPFSLYLPVAGDDERGPRGQPPGVLRLLAHEIRRWAPVAHHAVAAELDAQADHLERGGSIHDSPVLIAHCGPRLFD